MPLRCGCTCSSLPKYRCLPSCLPALLPEVNAITMKSWNLFASGGRLRYPGFPAVAYVSMQVGGGVVAAGKKPLSEDGRVVAGARPTAVQVHPASKLPPIKPPPVRCLLACLQNDRATAREILLNVQALRAGGIPADFLVVSGRQDLRRWFGACTLHAPSESCRACQHLF